MCVMCEIVYVHTFRTLHTPLFEQVFFLRFISISA